MDALDWWFAAGCIGYLVYIAVRAIALFNGAPA